MNPIFYGLLALLAWAPLPLGSNRVWAWAVLVVGCCLLSIAWLAGYALGRFTVSDAFRRARWVLAAGAVWLLYIGLQLVPLPAEWVRLLSPVGYEAHAVTAAAFGQPPTATLTISVDPHATRDFWFKSLAYGCMFCLTLLLADTRRRLELLLKTLVICGTLQALYASVMVLSGLEYGFLIKKYVGQGTATGTFINRNHLAGYLNLCLAMGIGLMIAKLGGEAVHTWRQRLRSIARLLLGEKTRLRIYLIVMVIGLVLTRSRMGNTAFFAGTFTAGAIALLLMRNAPRSTLFFLASIIALDILIVGSWFGVDQVAKRIQGTEVTTNIDNPLPSEHRDEVDREAMSYAKDFLLTGSGGGSFYVTFPAYSSSGILGFYDHAHNDYAQLLTETGIIGFALCALIVAMAAVQALQTLRRRNDPLMRGTAFGVTRAICWLAIHSAVDFNMQIPANALTMTVILALAWVAASVRAGESGSR
ncbi:MAG: O-antigen ligase family protein [Betaproteobacteria bacterium]|nr:O-antigen ligase family protein [Betaproteobacteria bacterium]